MICAGVIESARFAATYPPLATYASNHVPSAFPSRVETTGPSVEMNGLAARATRRCSAGLPRSASRRIGVQTLPVRRAGRRTVRRAGPSARSRTHTGTRLRSRSAHRPESSRQARTPNWSLMRAQHVALPRAADTAGSCRHEVRAGLPASCGTSSRRTPPRARGRPRPPDGVRPRTPPRKEHDRAPPAPATGAATSPRVARRSAG